MILSHPNRLSLTSHRAMVGRWGGAIAQRKGEENNEN